MAPKLILTGFMATGKSAVARAIARRLHWRLIDNHGMLRVRWPSARDLEPQPFAPDALESLHQRSLQKSRHQDPLVKRRRRRGRRS